MFQDELKLAKARIRPYLDSISEDALIRLMAMSQDGKVKYTDSCRCIRGIVGGCSRDGYNVECGILALTAEDGLNDLGIYHKRVEYSLRSQDLQDYFRNRLLYPMCRAALRRRSQLPTPLITDQSSDPVEEGCFQNGN